MPKLKYKNSEVIDYIAKVPLLSTAEFALIFDTSINAISAAFNRKKLDDGYIKSIILPDDTSNGKSKRYYLERDKAYVASDRQIHHVKVASVFAHLINFLNKKGITIDNVELEATPHNESLDRSDLVFDISHKNKKLRINVEVETGTKTRFDSLKKYEKIVDLHSETRKSIDYELITLVFAGSVRDVDEAKNIENYLERYIKDGRKILETGGVLFHPLDLYNFDLNSDWSVVRYGSSEVVKTSFSKLLDIYLDYKRVYNVAFIDGQNLYKGLENSEVKVDFFRLRKYLKHKYRVEKAFYYVGYIKSQKKLYESLKKSGFDLVFKNVTTLKNQKVKGNVDAEIVLDAVKGYYLQSYDKAVIVAGDGDYKCLVDFLDGSNSLERILIPNSNYYSHHYEEYKKKNKLVFLDRKGTVEKISI